MSIRKGIPHVYSTKTVKDNWTPSLSLCEFESTIKDGFVYTDNITEKTDGQFFLVGMDHAGFYSQHTGSGINRARSNCDHYKLAMQKHLKRGGNFKADIYRSFDAFHELLHDKMDDYLRSVYQLGYEPVIRGEVFMNSIATIHNQVEVSYNYIKYDSRYFGEYGAFVIHSAMNHGGYKDHIWRWCDDTLTITDDRVKYARGATITRCIDVMDILEEFKSYEFGVLTQRTTPKNREEKTEQFNTFNNLKKKLHARISNNINVVAKWGNELEGIIIHPSDKNPAAARFKLINEYFLNRHF